MLLSFSVENYKSFLERAVFQMIPAPKQHGLDYSVLEDKVNKKNVKALCSSVIYGPNAAGKTNSIGAMDTLRAIVLRGNIRNAEEQISPNKAAYLLELIPNNTLSDVRPVCFAIEFTDEGMKYTYEMSAVFGTFLDNSSERKVIHEKLCINDETVFVRDEKITLGELKVLKRYVTEEVLKNIDAVQTVADLGIAKDDLFIMNGFKQISPMVVKNIAKWLTEKFMVIYRANDLQLIRRFSDPQKQTVYIEKTISKAAKEFGINSNNLGYAIPGEDGETKLVSVFSDEGDKGKMVLAEVFESFGTIRFINLFPLVLRAIATGGTLIVDEFDASIHPVALMSILNVFHNDEINIHNAQLIFNTHNPIFLNSNLLRRDEIKFVEKNDNTLCSELYSLADFGTAGDNGVRKGEDYLKNYFVSRYGAIKEVDFSPIFKDLIDKEEADGK